MGGLIAILVEEESDVAAFADFTAPAEAKAVEIPLEIPPTPKVEALSAPNPVAAAQNPVATVPAVEPAPSAPASFETIPVGTASNMTVEKRVSSSGPLTSRYLFLIALSILY